MFFIDILKGGGKDDCSSSSSKDADRELETGSAFI